MKLSALNEWLSLAANVGVLIGIAALVVELNQNTTMMSAEMAQSRAVSAMQFQQAFYTDDYLPKIVSKVENEESLTDEESRRYRSYIFAFNRNQDNALWQYDNGLLGESTLRSIRAAVREVIGENDLTIMLWDSRNMAFSDEYRQLVESEIAELRN